MASQGNRVFLTALILVSLELPGCFGCFKRLVYHGRFPLLYVDACTSTFDVGRLVGSTFARPIKERLAESVSFHKVKAFCATPEGRDLLNQLKALHHGAFPAYWAELTGLAAGSQVPFDEVFMLNMRQEILAAAQAAARGQHWTTLHSTHASVASAQHTQQQQDSKQQQQQHAALTTQHHRHARRRLGAIAAVDVAHMGAGGGGGGAGGGAGVAGGLHVSADEAYSKEDACSDALVAVQSPDDTGPPRLLMGHNEDMTCDTLRPHHVYFVKATMGRRSWFAFTYAGELASTAFAATSSGISFTLDVLYPKGVHLPGLGRNFLSRALLDAQDMPGVLDLLGMPGQALGRSVNVLDVHGAALYNIEIGPGGSADVMQVPLNSWYFHANAYLRLPQPQHNDPSSTARQGRAAQFALPVSPADVLQVLGDTSDPGYPIYRSAAYGAQHGVYTIATVVFDLASASMVVLDGNPRDGRITSVLNLNTLTPRMVSAAEAAGLLRGSNFSNS